MRISRSYFLNVPLWSLLYIIAFVIVVLGKTYPDISLNIANYIKSPIVAIRYFFYNYIPHSIENFIDNTSKIKILQQENQILEKQLAFLGSEKTRLNILERENKEFKNLLNYKDNFLKQAKEVIVTKVTIPDINSKSFNKEIILNVGKEENIKSGLLVVSTKGVVGYIKEVYKDHAVVLTSTASDFRISATTSNSNMNVVIVGNGTLYPSINIYYEKNPIKDNEILVTSGLEGVFPAGIPIGKLIKDDKGSLVIDLFENFSTLNYVYVVR